MLGINSFIKVLKKINNDHNNRLVIASLITVIILYPFLFIWQGGDLTDVGYTATVYQNFFGNLQVGETGSMTFFTDFIGALWFKVFPNSGIIGLKFLGLMFLYTIIGITYLILKNLTKDRLLLLIGIFCGVVFSTRYVSFVPSSSSASWFFTILTSFFVIRGLNTNKLSYFYFAGILLAFASLSRFPNIVFIALLPIILIYSHIYRKTFTLNHFWTLIKQYFLFVVGMLSLFAVVYWIFEYFNSNEIILSNLHSVKNSIVGVNKSSYSTINLFKIYLKEVIEFLPYLLAVTSLLLSTSLIYEYAKIKKKYLPFLIFTLLLFGITFISYSYSSFSYMNKIKYFVPAFCAFPLILSLIKKDKFSIIVIVISVATISQVVGTNTGLFLKSAKGFMVLIPLCFLILAEKKQFVFENIRINTKPILIVGAFFVLFFGFYARIGWIYHVDSGLTSRLRCIYPVEHSKMRGILTTKDNAQHIKQLYNSIEQHIDDENSLFIYGHQPMFYYLTENSPPVKKFWLANNVVQVDELFLSLEKSVKSTGKYPLIVDTKQNILGDNGQNRLKKFLKDYGYDCIEDNEDFKIWKKIDA